MYKAHRCVLYKNETIQVCDSDKNSLRFFRYPLPRSDGTEGSVCSGGFDISLQVTRIQELGEGGRPCPPGVTGENTGHAGRPLPPQRAFLSGAPEGPAELASEPKSTLRGEAPSAGTVATRDPSLAPPETVTGPQDRDQTPTVRNG